MNKFRRYSINIPRYYSDRNPKLKGQAVSDSDLARTVKELEEKVTGMTGVSGLEFPIVPRETVPFEGAWRHIRDIGVILYIDVPVSEEENMDNYLSKYKEVLADRFAQTEMYIVSWEIKLI